MTSLLGPPGFPIVAKRVLAPGTVEFHVRAPRVAARRQPGNFIILRLDEYGERIPLTIAGADPVQGTIRVVVQAVGRTTTDLCRLEVGDRILDLLGPLGHPTPIARYGHCVLLGGGYGAATLLSIAEALLAEGNDVTAVIGARTRERVILVDDLRALGARIEIATDDGSLGTRGLVTDVLARLLATGLVDWILAVGPMPMMRAVSEMTRPRGIPTLVSLNPIMMDGTGMCGACRVRVHGEMKFACVDGPEFDGHGVDFDELAYRQRHYVVEERRAMDEACHAGQ